MLNKLIAIIGIIGLEIFATYYQIGFSPEMLETLDWFASYFLQFNGILPTLAVVQAILLYLNTLLAFWVFKFVYRIIID